MTAREAKRELRASARDRRRQLATAGLAAGDALADRAIEIIDRSSAGIVGGYWPLGDEIDSRPLLHRLARTGYALALPCVIDAESPLLFRRWQPGAPLRPGRYRVMEPAPEAATVRPDLLLVPMLAFDEDGYRLGYGGGYYDRTIAALEQAGRCPYCVGLAFSGQRVERLPREEHDRRLDAVLTESGPVRLSTTFKTSVKASE